LGLDLQGGTHLVLRLMREAVESTLERISNDLRKPDGLKNPLRNMERTKNNTTRWNYRTLLPGWLLINAEDYYPDLDVASSEIKDGEKRFC